MSVDKPAGQALLWQLSGEPNHLPGLPPRQNSIQPGGYEPRKYSYIMGIWYSIYIYTEIPNMVIWFIFPMVVICPVDITEGFLVNFLTTNDPLVKQQFAVEATARIKR
jgi:hypothetical protein